MLDSCKFGWRAAPLLGAWFGNKNRRDRFGQNRWNQSKIEVKVRQRHTYSSDEGHLFAASLCDVSW